MNPDALCCDERRIAAVRGGALNGVAAVEVVDQGAGAPPPPIPLADPQRWLRISFVNAPAPAGLGPANVRVAGGDRVTGVRVDYTAYDGQVLVAHVDRLGDFSPYELRIVQPGTSDVPLAGMDALLSRIAFSFKVGCPSDLDCKPADACAPTPAPEPRIDYLAKDWASLKRALLDRMALLVPGWTERREADFGVALVELLAYVGDALSYQQDAVATEAYLSTARRRVSVRRHARLVDYPMHDGCNARAFVALDVAPALDGVVLPGPRGGAPGTRFLTRTAQPPGALDPSGVEAALRAGALAFEATHDLTLFAQHGTMGFYTWSDGRCCLAAGATHATLAGTFPDLAAGDLLVLEEVLGPQSGEPADADPAHRAVVRLTSAQALDSGGQPLVDPVTHAPITEIAWGEEDALAFPLCLSSRTDDAHGGRDLAGVSVARGNVVLVDHGLTGDPEPLDAPPSPSVFLAPPGPGGACDRKGLTAVLPRWRPHLSRGPLTQAASVQVAGGEAGQRAPFDPGGSAASALRWTMADVLPAVAVQGQGEAWFPVRDLLDEDPFATAFVVEVDDDGAGQLRFGDDEYGARPQAGAAFTAIYRTGNGAAGNVGPEAIAHLAAPAAWSKSQLAAVRTVRNPRAAEGGVDPEPAENVRRHAPSAFRVQERAVTTADWAEVTERRPDVQRAAGTLRWTGSWITVFDTVELRGGAEVAPLAAALAADLERYRVVGRDLEVNGPEYVDLELWLSVCVQPSFFRADVERALLAALGAGTSPDGRQGFFHPDRFTFAQPVWLSAVAAAAQEVPGVDAVVVTRLRPLGAAGPEVPPDGRLAVGPLQVARLANDPDFPERGVLKLTLRGGA